MLSPGPLEGIDFEAVETAARRAALQLMARLVEQRCNASRSDLAGPTQPCSCGQPARYKGRVPKTFTTALGPLTLQRAYYHCAACGHGFYPRDRALHLDGSPLSPAATRMVGSTAAQLSFAAASDLLGELAGLCLPTKQVERSAKALSAAIAADERAVLAPEPARAATAYLGMDGTGVPTPGSSGSRRPAPAR